MASLLNKNRPPVFCPGCSHDTVLRSLDRAFQNMGLQGNQIAMVSDIGCSGLFDTFFNTHALHGLHGRALTYAAGIKLARPELHVVVTMGDGGLGIGAAHLLAACRRNLDLTLLLLNNFNFGMTGGQFSATTPPVASIGSGFLNSLEQPMDAGKVVKAAGAPFVARASAHSKDLPQLLERALRYEGFSFVDVWGICPGRYLRRNKLTPQMINENLMNLDSLDGSIAENERPEYLENYKKIAAQLKPAKSFPQIEATWSPPEFCRQEIVLLGAAGQRIQTAGETLCIAGLTAGLNVTQKNDYGITVMTGPSVSEIVLSPESIHFTGITNPTIIIALAEEGVNRRRDIFARLDSKALVIQAAGVEIPASDDRVISLDFKGLQIKKADWALASLAVLAAMNKAVSREMLDAAVNLQFKAGVLEAAKALINKTIANSKDLRL